MGGVIHIPPSATTANSDCAGDWIYPSVFDSGQIDHQTVITNPQSAGVVAATPNCQKNIIFTGEIHTMNHVASINGSGDDARLFIDHAVVDLPSGVKLRILRADYGTSKISFELRDGIVSESSHNA